MNTDLSVSIVYSPRLDKIIVVVVVVAAAAGVVAVDVVVARVFEKMTIEIYESLEWEKDEKPEVRV